MQGQRGTVGSLPETIDFDLGSSSNNAAMDRQICWNNMRNPPENCIPDYLLSPSDMDIAFVNSNSRERQTLNRWHSNEASSSNIQSEAGRDKLVLGWPSSGPCPVSGPRFEEQRREPTNNDVIPDNSANLMFAQSSNTNPVQSNLNLGFVGHSGGNSQVTQFPNTFKFGGGSENEQSLSSGSDRFLLPSGSGGFLVGERDGRQGPMDRGQVSCKRKAIEGSIGPSSSGGSCSYFQRTDSYPRPGLSVQNPGGSGLSIYTSAEQGTPRLGLGFPDPNVADNPESSHRNLRLRTSSSTLQNSVSPSILSAGRALRRSALFSSQPSMSLLPVDHGLDLRPNSAVDNMQNPSQLPAIDAPPLPQTAQSLRWGVPSASRNGGSSASVAFGDRDALPREELNSRSMARTAPDNPIPATDLRNLVRHPTTRAVAGGSINIPANGASTSRAGSSSNVNPALAPAWPPHHNPQQYPRRFSEYLRRSLFSSAGAESGGQGGNYLPLRPGQPGSSQEMAHPAGASNQGRHHQPHARLASWLERHNENGLGIHYSLRALGASGEGGSRLVSEIRNVLGIIRRGESLRFEDVMILDPAVFAGMADMHDRHRDMRLDIDNMSYEELLALEERIGNVSTGLGEETVLKCLKQKKYAFAGKPQSENEPCCVCQEDYNEGEDIGTLNCGHDFHTDCIKQWLTQKNLCPICKTTALKT